ncbi:hypothetical protein QBC42DRAFT_300558 [Cladorrhinum samala]|uniref:Fungal N-terminal domain-containing protein n=1 Tax=Cladorrhinum samala TaxID=585594 RepID=A0AAV9HDW7_9PEZI|nr:hypothetical protein QBC42DRAFT_300558 [Cladorrhinum samala]
MAEILGIVSGSFSVVAFAGELAKSATFVHDFISNIKRGPDELYTIAQEIKTLQSIFTEIQNSGPVQNSQLQQALQHSEKRLTALVEFVKKLDDGSPTTKPKLWSRFKVAAKQSDLTKYLGELERSKSILLQACHSVARDEQVKQSSLLGNIQQSLAHVSTEQQACTSVVTNLQSTVEEVRGTASNLTLSLVEITDITTETRTNTQALLQRTEKIETAIQTLVQESLRRESNGPAQALSTLEAAASSIITATVKREVKRHLRSQKPSHGPLDIADCPSAADISKIETGTARGTNPSSSTMLMIPQRRQMTRWTKQSLTSNHSREIKIPYIGKALVRTTATSYILEGDDGTEDYDVTQKTITTTTVHFIPAPKSWLTKRGGILTHESTLFSGRTRRESIPSWRYRVVNVIPRNSEIFQACEDLDVDRVRRLLDRGLASPYDVDEHDGRGLLATLAGAIYLFPSSYVSEWHLSNLRSLVELFTRLGIDSGLSAHDGSHPISSFIMSFDYYILVQKESPRSELHDFVEGVLDVLLSSAQTDPFEPAEPWLMLNRSGRFHVCNFPGTPRGQLSYASLRQLVFLIRQQRLEITWNNAQLRTLCDPWHYFGPPSERIYPQHRHIGGNVSFWVTATIAHVEASLNARLEVLRCFLEHGRLDIRPGGRHELHEALQWMARVTGAGVINILLESNYDGTGRRPWVRHRWRKLLAVRVWLLNTFKLLLEHGRKQGLDMKYLSEIGDDFSLHHHVRISSAWTEAVQAVFPQRATDRETEPAVASLNPTGLAKEGLSTDHEVSAESEWETEEEWAEEHLRELEESDSEQNPQIVMRVEDPTSEKLRLKSKRDFLSADYDERYWSQFYPRLKHLYPFGSDHQDSNGETNSIGTQKPTSGSKLWKVASAARDILSTVV